jgi:hypothetical protein
MAQGHISDKALPLCDEEWHGIVDSERFVAGRKAQRAVSAVTTEVRQRVSHAVDKAVVPTALRPPGHGHAEVSRRHQCCSKSFAFQSSCVPSGSILRHHRHGGAEQQQQQNIFCNIAPPHDERNLARGQLLTRDFEGISFVACKTLHVFNARHTAKSETRELIGEERLGVEDR